METQREFVSPEFGIIVVRKGSNGWNLAIFNQDGTGRDVQVASSMGIFSMPDRRQAFRALRADIAR